MSLELALDTLERSAWEGDHSAGGKYAAFGIGFMDTRQPKPFFLRNHRFKEQAATITTALSGIFGAVAAAVLNYVPDAFRQNENLKCCNENFSFPPLHTQGPVGWFMHQVVIRRLGLSCGQISKRGTSEENLMLLDCM